MKTEKDDNLLGIKQLSFEGDNSHHESSKSPLQRLLVLYQITYSIFKYLEVDIQLKLYAECYV